jgi:hypothetical protein
VAMPKINNRVWHTAVSHNAAKAFSESMWSKRIEAMSVVLFVYEPGAYCDFCIMP